mmetsp:Transcript_5219/g.16091  ORF Transcript_5219/g.16091 Transcript_5219/m.16091 type:complete len:264 (+) Transcript_5219:255-1046(+)
MRAASGPWAPGSSGTAFIASAARSRTSAASPCSCVILASKNSRRSTERFNSLSSCSLRSCSSASSRPTVAELALGRRRRPSSSPCTRTLSAFVPCRRSSSSLASLRRLPACRSAAPRSCSAEPRSCCSCARRALTSSCSTALPGGATGPSARWRCNTCRRCSSSSRCTSCSSCSRCTSAASGSRGASWAFSSRAMESSSRPHSPSKASSSSRWRSSWRLASSAPVASSSGPAAACLALPPVEACRWRCRTSWISASRALTCAS